MHRCGWMGPTGKREGKNGECRIKIRRNCFRAQNIFRTYTVQYALKSAVLEWVP